MRIHLLAVGDRMPAWVTAGYEEFSRRLPAGNRLILHEISAARRGKRADIARLRREEGERLLAAVPGGALIVALDEGGQPWSTRQLASEMERWRQQGSDVALLVGGADGLDRACLAQARYCWSLSNLTLPHALVRVLVAEQLYRAWSLLHHHPYHRD